MNDTTTTTTTTAPAAAAEPRTEPPEEFMHAVTYLEWLIGDVLRLRAPRAICGASLIGDPDRAEPINPESPLCPRCAPEGPHPRDRYVPGWFRRTLTDR